MASSDFIQRHIGPDNVAISTMLSALGAKSLDDFVKQVIPQSIHTEAALDLPLGVNEAAALAELRSMAAENKVKKSLLGQGYYHTYTPSVIKRNVLENPAWYTAYTPYQPEIAQGRLEVLFNFQTMITELTAMPIANASLLDEATAAAEAMTLAHRALRGKRHKLLVADDVHPQSIAVLQTRAEPLGIDVQLVSVAQLPDVITASADNVFGVLLQYPGTTGEIPKPSNIVNAAKACGAMTIVAADLLALTLLEPPGEWGADIVVGSAQRFGVPMGYGGPHAAFMATTDKHKRNLPGRLIGESITVAGKPAYRLALQTREQHIRREKATSNICTAQALLAIMATLYACYHGPQGLRTIARRVRTLTSHLSHTARQHGVNVLNTTWFDTLAMEVESSESTVQQAADAGYNIRVLSSTKIAVSLDESTGLDDVANIVNFITGESVSVNDLITDGLVTPTEDRKASYLSQPCFHDYQTETTMMRYLRRLADKDIALDRAMIPLGSCTMKLNAASEMEPITWSEFADIHPFAPSSQTLGYQKLIDQLENMLCACTGYDAVSLQPNAGSQGEYAGLLAIKRYHESRHQHQRKICLIPSSAHGTNPASAQMAGMSVVVVDCDEQGNVDLSDLQAKLDKYGDTVSCIMITYPSTHGVFETHVRQVCEQVHDVGGQVYIDGANMNAMVGTAAPGKFGGDVSHLNLHKTFCIPHGGGGPGVGPIGVGEHLKPFLPGHQCWGDATGAVSAAPWGSAMILPISWMYIRMMGSDGLRHATEVAILSANYIAKKLSSVYPILYRGKNNCVAHECILDTRALKEEAGITVDDIAKRLMDYGFHAPTMSFPVPGTLMVEPTESEPLNELDRFCDAMLAIHAEAMKIQSGEWPADDNPLVNAPHTAEMLLTDDWSHPYSRTDAAVAGEPIDLSSKYWPPVSRIDNVYGDKNLICSCPPLSDYQLLEDDEAA
ncbi:MAG: aminomethyl-transferring glycine dehydrogenase [Gammaproteobacteria bacterium]|nr:aminomethyl-transferring glycine dehydrogenase [Gammaproteobacteria bacterium]